jgi:phage shock protein C
MCKLRHRTTSFTFKMNQITETIKAWFERHAFGVCDWWGEMLGIKSSNIRLFFIYTSFITIGSPVILYLVMAFWKRMGMMLNEQKRGSVWDL